MKEKESILKFLIFSIIFTFILGTLLHFTYEWSNNNVIVGAFSAVNESTWEHLKLVFYPMLITTIIGYLYIGKNIPNFVTARLKGILIAMIFIVVFFYTYTGILGNNYAVLDIGSFFVAVILGEVYSYKLINSADKSKSNEKFSWIFLLILLLCFIFFTYMPPEIGLFEDPISNDYGIKMSNLIFLKI